MKTAFVLSLCLYLFSVLTGCSRSITPTSNESIQARPIMKPTTTFVPFPTTISELNPMILPEITFTIFVPQYVPSGLQLQSPIVEKQGSRVLVQINYVDAAGMLGMQVLNGPVNCCLDYADKRVNPMELKNGSTAYYLHNGPDYGGDILWWQQDKTYLAISGPKLTKEDLIAIANSMMILDSTTISKSR